MKVVALFKWSRNPVDGRVSMDGNVDWGGAKLSASEDDPAVMEVARAIGDEIVALTIGDGDVSWAAARGAVRTVVIEEAATELNSLATGAVLAAGIRSIGDADVVLIGDSSWDYGVVAALMGKLGWLSVAGVTAAEPTDGGLQVTRKIQGAAELLEVGLPVVLGVLGTQDEKVKPGMKDILASRKKPVDRLSLADLAPDPVAPAESRGTRFPDAPAARIIDGTDPVAATEELLAALRADGVL